MSREVNIDDGVIVVKNLTKNFANEFVLDNISLAAEKGKTKGRRIDDLSENELVPIRTQYGFLFQGGALFDGLSVYENIIFPLRQHRRITDFKAVDELVKSRLAMVGMDGYQQQYPASLSGGQKKRVALARAIALEPEVILYDEPTTGLDPIRSDIINELILKLQRELKITTIVVTHDMKSAYKIGDRIIMLHNGKIIADGDTEHIRNHPHSVVQQFIHGQVSDADVAALRLGGTKFRTQYSPDDFQEQ